MKTVYYQLALLLSIILIGVFAQLKLPAMTLSMIFVTVVLVIITTTRWVFGDD